MDMPGFDGVAGFAGGIGILALVWFALMVALLVGVIALIALGIRWLVRHTEPGPTPAAGRPGDDTALALLRERFARGEIDATEFEERKRTLGGG
jgi:putative membrane protein